jgi:TPR repeat protein
MNIKLPSFFTPVKDPNAHGLANWIGRASDNYWGGRSVTWVNQQWKEDKEENLSPLRERLSRVGSICFKVFLGIASAGLIPLATLIIKPIYRDACARRISLIENTQNTQIMKSETHPFQELIEAAEKGDVDSMILLGRKYLFGKGVVKDKKEALRWFEKAAEKENPVAMCYLGMMYRDGRGVEKDDKKAFDLFQQAADKENVDAMNYLGNTYFRGIGVEKDEKKAFEWFEKAAKKGDAYAKNNLGVMLALGRGCERNNKEAFERFKEAAREVPSAQLNLALMYEGGLGTDRNHDTAQVLVNIAKAEKISKFTDWWAKEAGKNDPAAQFYYGLLFAVRGDEQKATEWFTRAADQGDEQAKQALKRMQTSS